MHNKIRASDYRILISLFDLYPLRSEVEKQDKDYFPSFFQLLFLTESKGYRSKGKNLHSLQKKRRACIHKIRIPIPSEMVIHYYFAASTYF